MNMSSPAQLAPGQPATKDTAVHCTNGNCYMDGLHQNKHGKIDISSPDADVCVYFDPVALLESYPSNPATIKKGKKITIRVGDKEGTVDVTPTQGPCPQVQQIGTNSPHQIVVDAARIAPGGTPLTSPNQIIID
jgi:hypothetical protein